jgi:hypothetical protein
LVHEQSFTARNPRLPKTAFSRLRPFHPADFEEQEGSKLPVRLALGGRQLCAHGGRTPRRFGRAALRQCYAREVNTLIPVFARRRTYMCEADATAAGNRAAKNEKRP